MPFVESLLKLIYGHALKVLKNEFTFHTEITDILLTSKPKSKNFIYGHSDFNILIIVHDNCHPKGVLNEFRAFLKKSILLDFVFNSVYIPILTESEIKTDTIKSFLVRKSYEEKVSWNSILHGRPLSFNLRKQDQFALLHNAFQSLDYFLLKEPKEYFTRSFFKYTTNATKVLTRLQPKNFQTTPALFKYTARIQSFFLLSHLYRKKFLSETWRCLTSGEASQEKTPLKKHTDPQFCPIEENLYLYLTDILKNPMIDDITLTPTIIRPRKERFQGKIFLDIHLNSFISTNDHFMTLENLKDQIKKYQSEMAKFRIRLTTKSLYHVQNEMALYPFPLEALYRRERTYSMNNYIYEFQLDHEQIIMASIHFLTGQFMRFRSLQQKTELIGSKSIKSLNLMYKYYLLWDYLKTKKFNPLSDEVKIRNLLTPQFSQIHILDEVTQEDWIIIKAQLKYLLKNMREELVKYDESLRILRF